MRVKMKNVILFEINLSNEIQEKMSCFKTLQFSSNSWNEYKSLISRLDGFSLEDRLSDNEFNEKIQDFAINFLNDLNNIIERELKDTTAAFFNILHNLAVLRNNINIDTAKSLIYCTNLLLEKNVNSEQKDELNKVIEICTKIINNSEEVKETNV